MYRLIGLVLLVLMAAPKAIAERPDALLDQLSAQERAQISQLSPEEREALIRQYGASRQQTSDIPLDMPETVVSPDTSGLAKTPTDAESGLPLFGYDLFSGVPTTFAPVSDIPVPVDYVVGPGDMVNVQLFGKEVGTFTLVVNRDGSLNFPALGPISVAGLTFDQMRQLITERVAQQMIGVTASVTMGELRSIRVFVLGDARRPGSYTVSSRSVDEAIE